MLRLMIVQGSPNPHSATAAMLKHAEQRLIEFGVEVDFLDLRKTPLPLFVPGQNDQQENYADIRERVVAADCYVLGTPDYHGGPSGVLKNFLDYFWREFTGKLFAYVCASHEKGLTAMDDLRSAVRQCYGWSLPYGVAGVEGKEVEAEGKVVAERLDKRITMMAHDLSIYGPLLAQQRRKDLEADYPSFLAILRGK